MWYPSRDSCSVSAGTITGCSTGNPFGIVYLFQIDRKRKKSPRKLFCFLGLAYFINFYFFCFTRRVVDNRIKTIPNAMRTVNNS